MKTFISFVLAVLMVASCKGPSTKSGQSGQRSNVSLTAAGATFPLPFYNVVFRIFTTETGIQVNYGGIGSGGGIRSLKDKVVDFGATDAYLTDNQLKEMPGEVLHIPTCIGAVVIAYNLPELSELKLSNELLEKIFMGEIKKWNDPLIKSNNPGTELPDLAISVVHRSDGSGTTQIFSDFMSKISEKWKNEVGTGKALKWPTGMAAKGNPGVAGTISQTRGAIGYIGSEFAFAQKIQTAKIQNSSGEYIAPDVKSISAAANGEIPTDTRVMLTNSSDPASYPISGFTWLILYKEQAVGSRTKDQALATVKLMDWLVGETAQAEAAKVHYAPLPEAAREKAKAILRNVTFKGEPLVN